MLCIEGVLKEPLLYLSLYLKSNREAYYDHLQSVRTTGDWDAWIKFFLTGIIEVANQATDTAQAILALFNRDRAAIAASGKSRRPYWPFTLICNTTPLANTTRIKQACNVSLPTVLRTLTTLESLHIIREITGKERHKLFAYQPHLDLLNRGTEPSSN